MTDIPPAVTTDIATATLNEFWLDRVRQHTLDSYAGVPLSKFPEDLRVYEHLLWSASPDTIIEIGTQSGGSALWFRDRLRTLETYRRIRRPPAVISIDIDQSVARRNLAAVVPEGPAEIHLLEASVTDPQLPARVARLVRPGATCFVVEDSAHVYETTAAALRGFARFVSPGGFMVVEDGCVDIEALRPDPSWPRGVLPALHDWLVTPDGRDFRVRRDLEVYGISCHPGGFLQRRS